MIYWLLNNALWALSERTTSHGFPIAYASDEPSADEALSRLTSALGLLSDMRPRWLASMRQYVRRIQIRQVVDASGKWHASTRQVDLDRDYLTRPDVSDAAIAATLVHEFTHGRIQAARVSYRDHNRFRVERLCVRQELLFLKSLPDSQDVAQLIGRHEDLYERAEYYWSDEELERRNRQAASAVGVPTWLVNALWRLRKWRGRVRAA